MLGTVAADVCDISDGDDLRQGCHTAVVVQDAVLQGQGRADEPGGVGDGADADDHDARGKGAAVGEAHSGDGGGTSQSGFGRELGPAGLAEYRETKHIWRNTRPTPQGWSD